MFSSIVGRLEANECSAVVENLLRSERCLQRRSTKVRKRRDGDDLSFGLGNIAPF